MLKSLPSPEVSSWLTQKRQRDSSRTPWLRTGWQRHPIEMENIGTKRDNMSKRRLYAVAAGLGVTASVALALLFGIFQTGPGAVMDVDPGASGSSVDAEAANEVASASGGEYGEGINVHGHWTIEVRDPDGGLVERREFDNALIGGSVLAEIVGGLSVQGVWSITLRAISGNSPCGTVCGIFESSFPLSGQTVFKTLSVSVPTSGPNAGKLVLSGSFTAPISALSNSRRVW